MHFTTLYLLMGEELEDLSASEIEEDFCDRFCYCCGETRPKYDWWCDWFQIGGRWPDIFKAKNGIHCDRGWSNDNAPIVEGEYSVCNIRDLTEPINPKQIYAIATKSRIYQDNGEWQVGGEINPTKFRQLLDKINKKLVNGVIALMDCHD